MKLTLILAALAVVVVTVNCRLCTNHDASTCTHTCPDGEMKACEHDVCTCSVKCAQLSDCPDCPSHTDPMGHTTHESKHCIDSACMCMPDHMMPPGGHHGP
ncbi:uncharacterized protein LOC132729895 [Ruditapes philippinarum]|uniref:uncharacterized protein LOC132729895 n=1 Tax=Ruditapes philippinarum TaxID=129788 RepID=UPI00295C2FA0|nr:uncharacterized protein LOC132729895 [Ruditapes philippinarum]